MTNRTRNETRSPSRGINPNWLACKSWSAKGVAIICQLPNILRALLRYNWASSGVWAGFSYFFLLALISRFELLRIIMAAICRSEWIYGCVPHRTPPDNLPAAPLDPLPFHPRIRLMFYVSERATELCINAYIYIEVATCMPGRYIL